MTNPIGVSGVHRSSAIELLTKESPLSIDEVAHLYEDQWAVLENNAHTSGFLTILTERHVRELLRQRSAEMWSQSHAESADRVDESQGVTA